MPSLSCPGYGMISYHPHKDEYKIYKDKFYNYIINSDIFINLFIVEEKNSHYHVCFTLDKKYIGKKRETFATLVRKEIIENTGPHIDIKVAAVISWPKKLDSWEKLLGYCIKGYIDNQQETVILYRRGINDSIIEEAQNLAFENTNIDVRKNLTSKDVLKLMINFVKGIYQIEEDLRNSNSYNIMDELQNIKVRNTTGNNIPNNGKSYFCDFCVLLVRSKQFHYLNDNIMKCLWHQAIYILEPENIAYNESILNSVKPKFNLNILDDISKVKVNTEINVVEEKEDKTDGTQTESCVPITINRRMRIMMDNYQDVPDDI